MADFLSTSKSYRDLLTHLKSQIRVAQVRASVAVNRELILLYWGIGRQILQRQASEAGEVRSLTGSRRTYVPNFQTWAAFPEPIWSICALSPRPGRMRQLSNR